jgi:Restriction endonuclease
MTISDFLQTLKSSGEGSFEDLVGELLEALTGLRFYAARSGDQGGRDGRASGPAGGYIVFECKRYSGDTALKDRDLMGGLAQAHISLPELDVWIIAASRDVTDQNLGGLQAFGKEHGIDIVPLESRPNGRGNLDFLVRAFPKVVERFADPGAFRVADTLILVIDKAVCQLLCTTKLVSSSSILPHNSMRRSSRSGVHIGATKSSCFGA